MAKNIPLASLTPAARRKRIAILAKNPGTRSSIPDKYLPAQFKAGRANAQKVKQENATIYNPTAILSGGDLRNAVKSQVDMQLNPQLAAFDTGIKNLVGQRDTSAARLNSYMGMYQNQANASAAALSNSGQQLIQQLAGLGAQSQSTLAGINQDISSRNTADMAVRGTGLQDNNRAMQAVDASRLQALGSSQDALNVAGTAAAGGINLGGTIAATAGMRAGDQQSILASKFNQQIADMSQKRAAAEASRGDLTAQTLDKMRQDQFTNLATMKGLDIKQADLQETVRKNKATEKLTGEAINQRNLASLRTARTSREKANASSAYQKAQIDIKRGIDPVTGKPLPKKPGSAADALSKWKLDFARKHGYLPSTGKGKKNGGSGSDEGPSLTTNEKITQSQKYGTIKNAVENAKADFKGSRQDAGRKAGLALLQEKPDLDPLYLSVALDMAYDGHVSRANAKKLHQRGLSVKDFGATSYQDWKKKNPLRPGRRSGPAGSIPGIGATR